VRERLDQAAVEADVGVGKTAVFLGHLVDVGENGEEGDGLDPAGVAEGGNLPDGQWLVGGIVAVVASIRVAVIVLGAFDGLVVWDNVPLGQQRSLLRCRRRRRRSELYDVVARAPHVAE
jgi:hypothetical protein